MDRANIMSLPVDIFILQLTYLPFEEVKSICTSNKKLHDYCSNPKYNNIWKQVIDDTYKNVPFYKNKLESTWALLGLSPNTYNYSVYLKMLDVLDLITRKMIYWKQGDMKGFELIDEEEYLVESMMMDDTKSRQFLAFFLLGRGDKMKEYIDQEKVELEYKDYYNLFKTGEGDEYTLNNLFVLFGEAQNLRGVKYTLGKGADPNSDSGRIVKIAIRDYNLPLLSTLLKYDVEQKYLDAGLNLAILNVNREAVKLLYRNGAEKTDDVSWVNN